MFEFRRQRRSIGESTKPALGRSVLQRFSRGASLHGEATGGASMRRAESAPSTRELPDVTGFLVVVLVTLGLFVVPVGATIMQGPAIVASILGR